LSGGFILHRPAFELVRPNQPVGRSLLVPTASLPRAASGILAQRCVIMPALETPLSPLCGDRSCDRRTLLGAQFRAREKEIRHKSVTERDF
jgi:hypothetical protein